MTNVWIERSKKNLETTRKTVVEPVVVPAVAPVVVSVVLPVIGTLPTQPVKPIPNAWSKIKPVYAEPIGSQLQNASMGSGSSTTTKNNSAITSSATTNNSNSSSSSTTTNATASINTSNSNSMNNKKKTRQRGRTKSYQDPVVKPDQIEIIKQWIVYQL